MALRVGDGPLFFKQEQSMKTISKLIMVCALGVSLSGCTPKSTSTTPPAALAPGFSSQADQTMDQVLVGGKQFYTDIQAKVVAGTYVPAASEKAALNTFASALNTAQVVYIAFHAGTATQAQAQAAVDTVTAQQTALQNTIGAK
jgi:hypothetical protein